jgi:23S rRNA (uracil1939-C5)-methyltransferase
MTQCHVLDERVGQLIMPLRELIRALAAYRSIPQIEVAMGDTQTALVFRHLEPLIETDMQALIAFSKQHNVHLYLQPSGLGSVHKVWPEDDDLRLSYHIEEFDLEMRFHPMDFTQVNAEINKKMVSRALAWLEPQPGDRILDLFCGLGNFTLPLARSGADVVGVEGSDAMVERGYENASLNQLDNVSFFAADLTREFTDQPWAKGGFDKILIDPPRSGALEIMQNIKYFQARMIVYVSCNPATLARDAGELIKQGYQIECVGVMDMFPHTAHVESMAVFSKV